MNNIPLILCFPIFDLGIFISRMKIDFIGETQVAKNTGNTVIQGDKIEEDEIKKEKQNSEEKNIFNKNSARVTSSESDVESNIIPPVTDSITLTNQSVPKHMKPGVYSKVITQADLEIGTSYLIMTPANIVSPSEMTLVLDVSSGCFAAVQQELPKKLPEDRGDWRLRRNDAVAVLNNEVWYRGVATNKKDGLVSVYLVDTGYFCFVDLKSVLPLPTELRAYPACAVQVNKKINITSVLDLDPFHFSHPVPDSKKISKNYGKFSRKSAKITNHIFFSSKY